MFGAEANPKGQRWIDYSVHEPIADWFQHHVDEWAEAREDGHGQQKHLAIILPRELGKTTMLTIAGQLWLHVRDPELSSYTGSESNLLSQKILGAMKATIDGSDPYSLFTRLYGNWSGNARSWTGKQIVHSARRNTARHDPSLGTFSVETSITGAHPDAIFYDDPISYERLDTDVNWMDSVNSQVTSLMPVIQSDGLIVWVGTRYGDGDHFGVAFDRLGVKTLAGMETDSIEVSEGGALDVYFLAGRDKEGRPATRIWDEDRMRKYEKADSLRYASQIMNDPTLAEENPITLDQLKQCLIPAKEVPWGALQYAILTDTAFWDGKSKAKKDETVVQVWGYPRNSSGDVYYIEGYGSGTWRAEQFGERLVALVQRYRAQGRRIMAITDEVTHAGKKGAWRIALQNYFHDKNMAMPTFHEFQRGGRGNNEKLRRIITAASFWVDGHVKVIDGAPGFMQLIDQMKKIGQMKVNPRLNDDWVDAMSDAFQPELYQPQRRQDWTGRQKAPWEQGAQLLEMDGMDYDDMWESQGWQSDNPRPPIK